ncbi:unnamed protein product [Closterium sp. NIES-53]
MAVPVTQSHLFPLQSLPYLPLHPLALPSTLFLLCSGEFVVVNKHLLSDLTHLGLWSPDLKNEIMYRNGSVEGIDEIPQHLRDIYKTVWELKQRAIVDMAADRGAFIDQSQSLNIHMDAPTFGKLTSLHFYTWGKGLKTGMYYLRTRGAADAIKFTVDAEAAKRVWIAIQGYGSVAKAEQGRAGQGRAGLGRAGQGRAGLGRAGLGRAGLGRY